MPSLTFHPEYDRHLTFQALAHCARDYKLVREVADGTREPLPTNTSLFAGIGADKLIGELWRQTQRGKAWDAGVAWEVARTVLDVEGVHNAAWQSDRTAILQELVLLGRDYVDQWQGVRTWHILQVAPADEEANVPRLIIPLGPGRGYLTMPDMEARTGEPGILTIVDYKTSKWPYNPQHWAYEPQMLTYCLAAEAHYKEPIQFQIDYMQRPYVSKAKKAPADPHWTCPITYPFPFDDVRRALAKSWLTEQERCRAEYAIHANAFNPEYNLYNLIEPWPRNPAACKVAAGSGRVRCPWEPVCFGGVPDEAEN